MRVLIFTQYFTPEVGATQTRLHTFAAGLAERGHEVEVICEIPNHPQGVVRPGYGRRPIERRRLDGFRVTYVWVRTSSTKTSRDRLAFYGSYMAMAATVGFISRRPDVILASSPPLPVAAAAAVVAARHRAPWVMDVRDLWPAAAVTMGELSSPRVVAFADQLEQWLYRNATAITTVTEPFREYILRKVGGAHKVHVIPNGTTRLYVDAAASEPDRSALALPSNKFIWTYAGNIGVAQGLDAAIEAADLLGDDFQLLIIGEGPDRARLEKRAKSLAGTVLFRDQVEQEEIVPFLRASNALLVSLAADPLFEKFVPSKLYDFCAVGRPVIVAAAGEAERLVGDTGAGIVVPPGDPSRLRDAVRNLRGNAALATRLAKSGHLFGRSHSRESGAEQLAVIVERVTKASSRTEVSRGQRHRRR